MLYLVNYADEKFKSAQRYNSRTALTHGGFDHVFECDPAGIDPAFAQENHAILSLPRGGGYWLWKPYFIRKFLAQMEEGQVLVYSDAGSYFRSSAKPLAILPDQFKQDVIPFELELFESAWTKRDAFVLMDCDGQDYEKSRQRLASFIVVRKSAFSIEFFDRYLAYCTDSRILTDADNVCGLPNFDDFTEHRHDQSVFSLLSKSYGLQAFRDPSQWGNSRLAEYVNSDYGQVIEHTRSKNPKEAKLFYRIKRMILPRKSSLLRSDPAKKSA
jgi:hypothetical protein